MLLELDGTRLLTDPVLGNRIGPLVRTAAPVAAGSIGPIDGVLLSHLHADHADLGSLRRVARCVPVLAPPGAAHWLRRHGLHDVRELPTGAEQQIGALRVTATWATHDRRRRPFGPKADPIGYVVRGSQSVYFAGDTDLFPAMADLSGSIDVALLPVWGWGPDVGHGHLDPQRAAIAVTMISPGVVIPIHWGTFALGRPARRPADPDRPAREFVTLVHDHAPSVDVRMLVPGQRTEL